MHGNPVDMYFLHLQLGPVILIAANCDDWQCVLYVIESCLQCKPVRELVNTIMCMYDMFGRNLQFIFIGKD